ncbi:hypothetical protein KFL_003530010, partial [Klebsormidium nitens]
MRRWVTESNRVLAHASLPPWTKAAHILLVFVHEIHPFQDGNGRMCRLLMNFVLAREGLPFTVLLTRGGANRARYVRAIKESYATGSCAPMVRRVLYAIDEARRALERFRGVANGRVEGKGSFHQFEGPEEGRCVSERHGGAGRGQFQGDGTEKGISGGGREGKKNLRGVHEERLATAGLSECSSAGTERETGSEGRQSEPCGRPFLDGVPEESGRQVYGEKEGRKRGRSPSVASSSSGGAPPGDTGSDDTGTSEGSEGGGQWPGGNGAGGGGDSEDTGSDDTVAEDADTGTEEGSSSEEDTAQASSGTEIAQATESGTDTGTSDSDTQPPVADGSSDSETASVHESDTGSSEEEGHPVDGSNSASISDTGGSDSDTQLGPSDSDTAPHPSDSDTSAAPYPSDSDTAPHPSDSDTAPHPTDSDTAAVPYPSDSDTVGTDHPDTGTEDLGTDEGSYSDENGGGSSSADWSASGGSDDGTDDDVEGGGEWPGPPAGNAPAPLAPAPSVHIDLVAADDEAPKEGDEANTCTICMERKKYGVVIPCGHLFC